MSEPTKPRDAAVTIGARGVGSAVLGPLVGSALASRDVHAAVWRLAIPVGIAVGVGVLAGVWLGSKLGGK